MSRAKVTIHTSDLIPQLENQGILVSTDMAGVKAEDLRFDIILDVCADCVAFEKKPRCVTDVQQELADRGNSLELLCELIDLKIKEAKQ